MRAPAGHPTARARRRPAATTACRPFPRARRWRSPPRCRDASGCSGSAPRRSARCGAQARAARRTRSTRRSARTLPSRRSSSSAPTDSSSGTFGSGMCSWYRSIVSTRRRCRLRSHASRRYSGRPSPVGWPSTSVWPPLVAITSPRDTDAAPRRSRSRCCRTRRRCRSGSRRARVRARSSGRECSASWMKRAPSPIRLTVRSPSASSTGGRGQSRRHDEQLLELCRIGDRHAGR